MCWTLVPNLISALYVDVGKRSTVLGANGMRSPPLISPLTVREIRKSLRNVSEDPAILIITIRSPCRNICFSCQAMIDCTVVPDVVEFFAQSTPVLAVGWLSSAPSARALTVGWLAENFFLAIWQCFVRKFFYCFSSSVIYHSRIGHCSDTDFSNIETTNTYFVVYYQNLSRWRYVRCAPYWLNFPVLTLTC